MVVRKKNLLDAFKASAPEGRTAAGRRSTAPTSAGGPFAPVGAAGGAPGSAARGPGGEAGSKTVAQWPTGARVPLWRRLLRDRAVRVALVVGALCIAVAYWAGRQHAPVVDAGQAASVTTPLSSSGNSGALLRSGAEAPAAPAETELAKRNLATAQAGSTHDQEFMNPANKYTVRVKTFRNDAAGLAAARALHEYFVKENLPVILPISQGQSCIVYVGHDDKKKAADLLAQYIQRMRGPGSSSKAGAFDDAYVVNIDSVVKR